MKLLPGLLACALILFTPLLVAYAPGDTVEVSHNGIWYKAKVTEAGVERWKISYDGYGSHWDEWVGPDRIRRAAGIPAAEPVPAVPDATAAAPATAAADAGGGADFAVGTEVEVLWTRTWYKAKVIETDAARGWKITYEGYASDSDEWVTHDRIRARAQQTAADIVNAPANAAPAPEAPTRFPFPQRPAGSTAGLDGAYLRVVSLYWNGQRSLTNEGWFFTRNGRFSRTPPGGIELRAFANATTAGKEDGVYWINGDKLMLRWAAGGSDTEYAFERGRDGVLKIGGVAAVSVNGVPRGWRADARYEGGASAAGGGTFIASSNSLHLRKDGSFDSAAVGSVSAGSIGGGSSGTSGGTYEFNGYELQLRHADGREERFTVFAFGDRNARGAPAYLWREGTMLRRRD